MMLWAGLGNPGAKYAMNRHNIGFMALDRIAGDHGFSPWKTKFQALVAEGRLGGEKLVLDRKSTRLNSSHVRISYAVFCLKKKKKNTISANILISVPHMTQCTPNIDLYQLQNIIHT